MFERCSWENYVRWHADVVEVSQQIRSEKYRVPHNPHLTLVAQWVVFAFI